MSTPTFKSPSCPGDPGNDNTTKDHVSTVKDGDSDVLDVSAEQHILQELMPDLEQDIYSKQSKTANQEHHYHKGLVAEAVNHVDRETGGMVMKEMVVTPREQEHLPLPTMGRHQLISMPGAYAHLPEGGFASMSFDEDGDIDNVVTSGAQARQDNEEGLAVANLVVDNSFEVALPHSEESIRERENKTKTYKTFVFLSVIFLLALGAVLLAVLVPSPNASSQAENEDMVASQAPTSIDEYVHSLLPEESVKSILDDSDSPQWRAFQWLLGDDLLLRMSDERIKQRFALATLYFATNGAQWRDNTNWLNYSVSECDWYTKGEFVLRTTTSAMFPGFLSGISFSEEGPTTICDRRGLYQHLWLDQNYLVGSLPEELYMLTNLKTISMATNGLQGTISTRIGLLTDLEGWGLLFCAIAGTIPTQIGLLKKLKFISSANNKHIGSIPSEIWKLTQLEFVSFSRNPQLSGTFPSEIENLSNLKWLGIDETGLSGNIPTEIAKAQNLEMISLVRNSFSGNVPSELGLLTKLFLFGAISNHFTGTIPTELGLLTSLSQLSLRGNRLEGPIPSQLGLLTNLAWTLNLRQNQFTGTIPSELGLLTGLYELELRDNRLTGQIPSELGQATSLGYLSFANNTLSGSIPEELYALHESLHTLSLDNNPLLSGILPNEICEINARCKGNGFNPCEGPYGFSFNCSSVLCGCGCNLCIP